MANLRQDSNDTGQHDTEGDEDELKNDRLAQAQADALIAAADHARAKNVAAKELAKLTAQSAQGGSWNAIKAQAQVTKGAHDDAAQAAREASAAHLKAADSKTAQSFSREADKHSAVSQNLTRKYSL